MGSLIEGAHIKNIAEKGGVCSRGRLIGGRGRLFKSLRYVNLLVCQVYSI